MFIGIFNLHGNQTTIGTTPIQQLKVALDPENIADLHGSWQHAQLRLVQTITLNTIESTKETAPSVCERRGLAIAAWVRLDNRSDLAASLSIDRHQLPNMTDPQLILEAYTKWGEECAQHLIGDFSFCIVDTVKNKVFAARDHLGVKPFYYVQQSDILVVTSGARALHAVDGLVMTPDIQWMADYMVGLSMSYTKTCWHEVKKLPPAHTLTYSTSNSLKICKYFTFKDNPPQAFKRQQHYVEAYREILEEAVRCRLRTRFPLASETSAGLDSSTITGLAAQHWTKNKNDFHTFGAAWFQDELDLILHTSRMHGVLNNHITTDVEVANEQAVLERSLLLLGFPEEHANGSTHEPFYRGCELFNVRTLLSGFGGDEVVTNSGQLLFTELLDAKQYPTLLKNLPGAFALRPARFAKLAFEARRGAKKSSTISDAMSKRFPYLFLSGKVIEKYNLHSRVLKSGEYTSTYRRVNDFILNDRLAPFVPTRMDNCTLFAAGRKIEYRWPLLDVRLIQQYLSTPTIEKYGSGHGRFLHRRAIDGVVPARIQWKSKAMGNLVSKLSDTEESELMSVANRCSQLHTDLHPALDSIINRQKILDAASSMKSDKKQLSTVQKNTYTTQLQKLTQLNVWLRKYHP